jgi:hypothetical protein
LRRIRL